MFDVLQDLSGQLRWVAGMGGGGATGLDFNAALALGAARGCDMELLAEVLPAAEEALQLRNAIEDGEDRLPEEIEMRGDQ